MLNFFCRLAVVTVSILSPQLATGQSLLESYVAQIGTEDRFNSKGAFVSVPEGILAQDRANFHRFGVRHVGDTTDSFFTSRDNRAKMVELIRNGSISPRALDHILFGQGVSVRVGIFGTNGVPEYIWVLPQIDGGIERYANLERYKNPLITQQVASQTSNNSVAVQQIARAPSTPSPTGPCTSIQQQFAMEDGSYVPRMVTACKGANGWEVQG